MELVRPTFIDVLKAKQMLDDFILVSDDDIRRAIVMYLEKARAHRRLPPR